MIRELCRDTFPGNLNGLFHCPLHPDSEPTLRIFLEDEDQFYFRCHKCGTCHTLTELIYSTLGEPEYLNFIASTGYQPQPINEIEEWFELKQNLSRGRQDYFNWIKNEGKKGKFGDWTYFKGFDIPRVFKNLPANSGLRDDYKKSFLVNIVRNIFGRPIRLVIHSSCYEPRVIYLLTPKKQTSLIMPWWCDFRDLDELIVCEDREIGILMEQAMNKWPMEYQFPIVFMEGEKPVPVIYSSPFSKVWTVIREDGKPELSLPFYLDDRVDVRVVRLGSELEFDHPGNICNQAMPKGIQYVTSEIIRQRTPARISERLNLIFSRKDVSKKTKDNLLNEVISKLNLSANEVLKFIEPFSSSYIFKYRNTSIIVRDGIYYHKVRPFAKYQPCSNFSVRLLDCSSQSPFSANMILTVEGKSCPIQISLKKTHSPDSLWFLLCKEAAIQKIPQPYFSLYKAKYKSKLFSIICATHLWTTKTTS